MRWRATSRWCPVKNEPQRAPEKPQKKKRAGENRTRHRGPPQPDPPPSTLHPSSWHLLMAVLLTAPSLAFTATSPRQAEKARKPWNAPVFSITLHFLCSSPFCFCVAFTFSVLNIFLGTFFFGFFSFCSSVLSSSCPFIHSSSKLSHDKNK